MRKLGVTVSDATDSDFQELVEHIRDIDRAEVLNIAGKDIATLLSEPKPYSMKTWAARSPQGLVALFGYANYAEIPGFGIPWLLATDLIEHHEKDLLALSKPYTKVMEQLFTQLGNYVASDNESAIRWLSWLGFIVDEPFNLPTTGASVRYFHKP